MQYKQASSILLELFEAPEVPVKMKLAIGRFLTRSKGFPKLGPFRKRSLEQGLWRVASKSETPYALRWQAVKKLLRMREMAQTNELSVNGQI